MVGATSDKRKAQSRRVRTQPQNRHVRQDHQRRGSISRVPSTVSDAIGAARDAAAWYLANFASTAGQQASKERRTARWALRGLVRQPGVSALERPAKCGLPLGGTSAVAVHAGADGTSHFSGLETCGSIWSCPVCAAKIRNHRAEEIGRALAGHIDRGGGAWLVTLTIPHDAGDELRKTVRLISDGFRAVNAGRAYGEDRGLFGILGHIRSFEITHGQNGWHPHLHVIVCTQRPATRAAGEALQERWQARWDRWLTRNGWRRSVDGIGVRVDRVRRDAEAVGEYIAKLQEGEKRGASVANEVTRADLKNGRAGSRVPFEILAHFGCDGSLRDLRLWQEYQTATKGRSAIRWSTGLRAELLPDDAELTDEEIAAAEVGAEIVAMIESRLYRAIANRPYGESYLHIAAERGGIQGIVRYVKSLGMNPAGVMVPDPSINANGG